MKNILIKSVLLLTILFAVSCEDEYEAPYGDFSSFSWYIPAYDFNKAENSINIDTYLAFADLSKNALSHEWIIPASCKYLNKNFTTSDSIYTSFIIEGKGASSHDALINVLFTEPGIHEVRLINVFKDSVAESVKNVNNNSWVVNKVFKVDVFANIQPAFKITHNGVEVLNVTAEDMPSINDKDSWPTVNIEAGDALVFEDLTTIGRPTGRKWYINGGKPDTSGSKIATILFNKLGTYTASMDGIRNGTGIPSYTVKKLIPLKINVIPSTKPFIFNGGLKLNADQTISFNVTGEVETLLNENTNFTVHVTNTAAGFDSDIAVSSAKINSLDATVIDLTLAVPVFNTDVITVAFTGGNIQSVDARVLEDFTAKKVSIPLGSSVLVANWAGFEDASSAGNTTRKADCDGYWVGAANDQLGLPFYRTTEKFQAGVASMKYESASGVVSVTLQGSDFSKPNGIEGGTYRVSYMVYLEPGNTMKAFSNALQSPSQNITWDISSLPRGEWVEISQNITTDAISSGTRFDLKIDIGNNPGATTGLQKMYFDSLSWVKLIPRT